MKKILTIISLWLLPTIVLANIGVGWQATSKTSGNIFPNPINGIYQSITAPYFTATSTTAQSTFAGYVGIGTTSPLALLDVNGYFKVSSSTAVSYDNFIRANNTTSMGVADSGQTWIAFQGTWGIISNQAYKSSSTGQSVTGIDTGYSNGTVQATLTVSGDGGPAFRISDSANYLFFTNLNNQLYKFASGQQIVIGNTSGTPSNGDVIKIIFNSCNISIYRNGVNIGNFIDCYNGNKTYVGFRQYDILERFNLFSFTPLSATTFSQPTFFNSDINSVGTISAQNIITSSFVTNSFNSIGPIVTVSGLGSSPNGGLYLNGLGDSNWYIGNVLNSIQFRMGPGPGRQFTWFSSSANGTSLIPLMSLDSNYGNLGIGTTSPSNKLEVAGNGFFSGNLTGANITATGTLAVTGQTTLNNASTTNTSVATNLFLNSLSNTVLAVNALGQVIATTTVGGGTNYFTNSGATTTLNTGTILAASTGTFGTVNATSTTGTSVFANAATFGGNVGIGTTNPTQTLDMKAGGTYGYNGVILAQASTTLNNYFFGNSGNMTMTGSDNTANGSNDLFFNTTGYDNIANGVDALFFNTTGYNNIANGVFALYLNTTGYENIANGVDSLFFNTTGNNNIANGSNALFLNTTGYDNIANGVDALSSNTTGYDNIANGVNAGKYIADGVTANQTSRDSVYEGYNVMAQASGDNNEIVIGASAIGNGSNSVTLGNSSITKTILNGNVGIGTTTPDSTLDINGTLRLEGSSTITTALISGAIVGLGCDTATTSVDSSVSSTTAFVTTPQTFPGVGLFWQTYYSAPSTITTEVCSDVTVTPVASKYNVKIIK